MMDEKQKKELAKKNLENFFERLQSIENASTEKEELVPCYVHLKDGSVFEDFFWTDHEISPTAARQWIAKRYNTYSASDDKWVVRVVLPDSFYKKLESMVEGEEIIIGDVLFTTQ